MILLSDPVKSRMELIMAENTTASKRGGLIWAGLILAALAAVTTFLVKYWRTRQAQRRALKSKPASPPQPIYAEIQGLTTAEAESRQVEEMDNLIQLQPRRTTKEILRYNTFSIFNLSLVGIAFVQLLLGKPLDALLSLGVMLLNIGLNTAQELIAKRRLKDLETATQPSVTVIRDGAARSIGPNEIVVGDILAIGPGDYVFVDGEVVGDGVLVMDESLLSSSSENLTKCDGEPVFAGSFCISGRAAFETQKIGQDRKISKLLAQVQGGKEELTPLENIINRILKGLLAIVAIFTFILLAKYFRLDLGIPSEVVIDATSVVFSIAPASLFFMILLTYAGGTADLARIGALVHRARSVESLAQVDTICFAKEGVLTGTHVEIEDLQSPDGDDRIADSRLRQILGDYTRSTSLDNFAIRAMVNTFEGSRRDFVTEAPFLAVFGWSAVTFDHSDLQGVYVLGEPTVLGPFLVEESIETTTSDSEAETENPGLVKRLGQGIGGLFNRGHDSDEEEQNDSDETTQLSSELTHQTIENQVTDKESISEEKPRKPGIFKRFVSRVGTMLQHEDEAPSEEQLPEEGEQQVELLFAYLPEPGPLHDNSGAPQLPDNLIPLCRLRYSEVVRQDAIKTINDFQGSGLKIKIFSAGNPDTIAKLLVNAGFSSADGKPPDKISGDELASLDKITLQKAAIENDIFGRLTPVQSGQIVRALRQDGQFVAVLGDGINDIPALRQANLAITRQSSSQATLSIADIVLLDDSPQALQRVLYKGQRILTGLLDILKLYLTQAFYLALIIPAILIISNGFPFKSIQNTVIATVSVTIPAVGLTFWAAARIHDSAKLSRFLTHFVMPAAITLSAAAFIVYQFFLTSFRSIEYAQLTLTYTLVIAGLLLVIFVRPPTRIFAGGSPLSRDWRPTWLVMILLFAFILVASIPLAQELLKIGWLQEPSHYLFIMLVVTGWAFTLRIIWRVWPLERTKVSDLRD
jgi:magnesium-transporting ATPase (P-type)